MARLITQNETHTSLECTAVDGALPGAADLAVCPSVSSIPPHEVFYVFWLTCSERSAV